MMTYTIGAERPEACREENFVATVHPMYTYIYTVYCMCNLQYM